MPPFRRPAASRTREASCIFDGCNRDDLTMIADLIILPDGCHETIVVYICHNPNHGFSE